MSTIPNVSPFAPPNLLHPLVNVSMSLPVLYRCCVSGSQSEAEGRPTSALSKHGDRHADQSKNRQECSFLEAKEALWTQLVRRRGLELSAPPGEEGLEWESAGFSLTVSGSGFRVLILESPTFQDSRFHV